MIFRITIAMVVSLSFIVGQNSNYKPHADELRQWGNVKIDHESGLLSNSQNLITRDQASGPSHVVFGYHPYWSGLAYQNYNYNLLSHIAWFGLAMNSVGNITDSNGWPVTDLVNLAHSHGVKVIVTVTLFDNDAIGTLLGNATYRQTAIDNLLSRVIQGNADGVNIDFEFVPSYAKTNFNTFIHDLTQAFHDQIPGSEVSIAMPSVDWSNAYDYNYLSDNCDGLMIMAYGYYWSGSSNAGPISPLNSGRSSWYIRRTIEDYLSKTGQDGSQLILGLPWYGRSWAVTSTSMGAATIAGSSSSIVYSSAEANAQAYGKQYNSSVPAAWYNYNNGELRQAWYDDSLSLAAKYTYAVDSGIKGIGIWALGYDGGRSEIWGGLNDAFGATTPPLVSKYFTTQNLGAGKVKIQCAASAYTDKYEIFTSADGINFSLTDSSSTSEIIIENQVADQLLFIKIRNTNSFGSSSYSEVLGTVVRNVSEPQVLIVQGFERTSGTVNNFDYIIEHGSAVYANGYHFDAASNDAIELGVVNLSDYPIVDWISGEEATATVSFSPTEQQKIKDYLEQGGRIFISGSEIGWDLEASGSTSDIDFYHNYFKADYIVDDAQSYSMNGSVGGIFSELTNITFDDGTMGTYDVDYPDGIKPYGGAVSNLSYSGADYASKGGAGIQYMGSFGTSTALGGIVYLGVGFEAIYPESNRNLVMGKVLNYLEESLAIEENLSIPQMFSVSSIYPNPFNTSFKLVIDSRESTKLTIRILNIRGQELYNSQKQMAVGKNNFTIHAFNNIISSGVYFLQLASDHETLTQSITYLK